MLRARLIALLSVLAVCLCAPAGAQARTPCANEEATPTALNTAQVSDAVFCLSNQIRAHFGLPLFRRDARLDTAAYLHSLDMGVRSFFDHVNPDGLNPSQRAAAQGYTLGVGENIAFNYANARAVVLGWMGSTGHCRNMLSSAIDLGVGTAVYPKPYYAQEFGDYFTRDVDEAPRDACPYALNLDTLGAGTQAYAEEPGASGDASQAIEGAAPRRLSLRSLSLAPSRFRAGRGTTISFTLSGAATVTLRVQHATGRGRSSAYRLIRGRLVQRAAAGANSVRFGGRIGGATLRAGRYRLQATATDAAGNKARVVRASFVVSGR